MERNVAYTTGSFYVRLKNVHLHWTHNSGPKRSNEAYIPIPAKYAYYFEIKKGTVYQCILPDSSDRLTLKAAGSQGKKEYAKQFQGFGNLHIVFDWYSSHNAVEGDYVIVSIINDCTLSIRLVKQSQANLIQTLNLVGESGRLQDAETFFHISQNKGFRLDSLIIKNNRETICEYHFMSERLNSEAEEPFVTLVVGENGAGKSYALGVISDIFYSFQNNSVTKPMPYEYYSLKYWLDGRKIEIAIVNDIIIAHCDDVLVESGNTAILPQKVLAIAFMLNDKYPFKGSISRKKGVYEYLGMRQSSNATWVNHVSGKASENIVDLAADGKLWSFMSELSTYLNIDPKVSIACELADDKYSFDEIKQMPPEKIAEHLKQAATKVKLSRDYRSEQIKELSDESYDGLAQYLQNLVALDPFIQKSSEKVFGMVIDTETSPDELRRIQNDYVKLQYLKNLRYIKNVTLSIYKDGLPYSFDDTSSGEKHILYTILNIANHIQHDSLVLIDEPEISLHPNWQMLYIGFIKKIFKEYASCHFVIASHSPYLVSDLSPESSALVVLRKEGSRRKAETIEYSTYAWSTENILYNVFHARTTRNLYFELDLRELLGIIDKKDLSQIGRAKELYCKLAAYVFDSKDPLNLILKEIKESLTNAEPPSYT